MVYGFTSFLVAVSGKRCVLVTHSTTIAQRVVPEFLGCCTIPIKSTSSQYSVKMSS